MFKILMCLAAGVAVGFVLRRWSISGRLESTTHWTVCVMLFVFGASLGSDSTIIGNIGRFGVLAFVIALLGVAGSYFGAVAYDRFFRKKGGER